MTAAMKGFKSKQIGRTGIRRYKDALVEMPASGGCGCHTALLRIANFGRIAGVDPNQIASDLAAHVHGARRVSSREIWAAVEKAFDAPVATTAISTRTATPRPSIDGARLFDQIVQSGADYDESALWEVSPVRVDWPPEYDAVVILELLYCAEDPLFLGSRHDAGPSFVRPVSEWIERFKKGLPVPEHVIPNPLTGADGRTKDGKISYRADDCVAKFRFAVVEFDAIPRDEQIRFWAGASLPIVALIDSGGKSVHGWIRVDAVNTDEWTERVEGSLFSLLTAVGADGACKNEARLSRTPGHFRSEKGRWQRIIYLNPAGGPIAST
jgi:hypothetical protein